MLINVNIINKITAAYKVTSQFMLENATKKMLERSTLGNNDALRSYATPEGPRHNKQAVTNQNLREIESRIKLG